MFHHEEESQIVHSSDGRIRGAKNRMDKDFVLGGLFPIHSDETFGRCGKPILDIGLELTEAMLFTLDLINNNSTLLKGITLGYDIRDSCYSENVGLDEAIELITTDTPMSSETCEPTACPGTMPDPEVLSNISAPTIGIVGAASSRVSVPVASLLRLFNIPQISYASSSALLSDRDKYQYFYRTIPSDAFQARAMIDILLYFNWTYVSTIYSQNTYGAPGIDEFRKMAEVNGICIDLDEGIDGNYQPGYFDELSNKLLSSTANVVIVFTSQNEAEMILEKISKAPRKFLWIASDAWSQALSIIHKYNTTAAGLYGVSPLSEHVETFHNYFTNLTIENDRRNPWFPEVYSTLTNCTLEAPDAMTFCDRQASFTQLHHYTQANLVPLVIDAVYTFAVALDQLLQENCDQEDFMWYRNNHSCKGYDFNNLVNGSSILNSISKISLVNPITSSLLAFDNMGNVQGKYDIYNYQARDSGIGREYYFERIGAWVSSTVNNFTISELSLDKSVALQFGIESGTNSILYHPIDSHCGRCSPGHYRILAPSDCCGVCSPCKGQNYSDDPRTSRCKTCGSNMWGNNPLQANEHCIPIPEFFLHYSNPWSIAVLIVAILGILAVLVTGVIFYIFWNTPIIKSSGREQMLLLLTGVGLSFFQAFVYVAPPLVPICALQRIILWFCVSLMFGALLIKIVRVARFFLRKVDVVHPRFTEPHYQVLFTFFIVAVQVLIVIVSLAVQHPNVLHSTQKDATRPDKLPTIVITCIPDPLAVILISVGYETVIIIIGTVLGVLSFKYPANFNESKYISFTTFALLLVWITFIIAYFVTEQMPELRNIAVSIAIEMSGYALLVPIFGPKLFIILFKPKQNTIEGSQLHCGVHTAVAETKSEAGSATAHRTSTF